MTTIIRLLVKGSKLLNRLRQQQASNRAGQAQKERDRRTEEERRKRVQQQRPAPVFAPDPQRRRIEPIATKKRKSPGRFMFGMLYLKSPSFAWPDGKVGQFNEPTPIKVFGGEEGGINIDDTEGFLMFDYQRQRQESDPVTQSEWWHPSQFLEYYNQHKVAPFGQIRAISQPSLQAWHNFNNRVPYIDGQFQRMFVSMSARHNGDAVFTYGYSYVTAPNALDSTIPALLTDVGTPEFMPVRTEPPGQAHPFTLYPFVLGPRGYGVSSNGADIFLDVFAPGSIEYSKSGSAGGQTRFGLYGDDEGCGIVYQPGDVIKIAPRVRSSIFEQQTVIEQANRFMATYWHSFPELEYTILEVIRNGQTIRYRISGANWPAINANTLDYYLMRSFATWENVILEESFWTADIGVVEGADVGGKITSGFVVNDPLSFFARYLYDWRANWYIAPGLFGSYLAASRDLGSISAYSNKNASGLPLTLINYVSDSDFAIAKSEPSRIDVRISEVSSGWNDDRPSDWLTQERDYWLWRGGINDDQTAYVLELAKERVDPEAQAGRPSQLTFYKVEVPVELLRPLWQRTDLGFPFVGTVVYIPPSE